MSTTKIIKILSHLALTLAILNVANADGDLHNWDQESQGYPKISSTSLNSGWDQEPSPDCKKQVKGQGWGSYSFGYGVEDKHTGDYKSHRETRQNGWTKGSYSLLQPDGILRTVFYEAAPGKGFKAVVHNKGWTMKTAEGHEKNQVKQDKPGWGF